MKFVYVLVSDDSDFYLEQTYLSLLSLRRYNPSAEVALVVDEYTDRKMNHERRCLLPMVSEYFIQKVDSTLSKKVRSRILKTRLRNIVNGTFLYIDCDTIILGKLPHINIDCDIAAVYSYHYKTLSSSPSYYSVLCEMDACGENVESEEYFNGGVFYVADTDKAHEFYKRWGILYELFYRNYKIDSDQQALYVSNNKMGGVIKELPGIWNCQLGYGLEYLSSAVILHYLVSTCNGRVLPIHLFQTKEFMQSTRRNLGYENYFMPILEKAKLSFLPGLRVTAAPISWAYILEQLTLFAKNRKIYLYGENIENKMANYFIKKANIKVCGKIYDGIDVGQKIDSSRIGVIVLGSQDSMDDSISKLALMGFIHFYPIPTDI